MLLRRLRSYFSCFHYIQGQAQHPRLFSIIGHKKCGNIKGVEGVEMLNTADLGVSPVWPISLGQWIFLFWQGTTRKCGKVPWNFLLETLNLTKQADKNFSYVIFPGIPISNQGMTTDVLHITRRERVPRFPKGELEASELSSFSASPLWLFACALFAECGALRQAEPWPAATAPARVPLASAVG